MRRLSTEKSCDRPGRGEDGGYEQDSFFLREVLAEMDMYIYACVLRN